MIPLTDALMPATLALLRADLPGSMFPLVNLGGTGLAMRAWVTLDPAGQPQRFLGLTQIGTILPQAVAGAEPGAWPGARAVLAGTGVTGVVGRPALVAGLRAALGLGGAPTRKNTVEPGFDLDLAALRMPDAAGLHLAPLTPADRETLVAWRTAYTAETLGADPATAAAEAPGVVDHWLGRDSHRLLWGGARPVALTGFNADLGDIVQVGGVFVPPALRNRGLARRAVALHLAQARGRGARRAVLFAASDTAARAYAAIGFRPAGAMALILFDGPQTVAP